MTDLPTPAKDRLNAAKASATLTIDDFRPQFEGLSKDEAIEQAKASTYWASTLSIKTKTAAVSVLARAAWKDSPEQQAIEALEKVHEQERFVIRNIERAQSLVDDAIELVEKVMKSDWVDTEALMDRAANLRMQQTWAMLWSDVRRAIEGGMEPVEAVTAVRKSVLRGFLSPFKHRSTSKSTSVTKNLCDDLDNEARAAWLDTITDYFGRVEDSL